MNSARTIFDSLTANLRYELKTLLYTEKRNLRLKEVSGAKRRLYNPIYVKVF